MIFLEDIFKIVLFAVIAGLAAPYVATTAAAFDVSGTTLAETVVYGAGIYVVLSIRFGNFRGDRV